MEGDLRKNLALLPVLHGVVSQEWRSTTTTTEEHERIFQDTEPMERFCTLIVVVVIRIYTYVRVRRT